jgi:hypothetical protein
MCYLIYSLHFHYKSDTKLKNNNYIYMTLTAEQEKWKKEGKRWSEKRKKWVPASDEYWKNKSNRDAQIQRFNEFEAKRDGDEGKGNDDEDMTEEERAAGLRFLARARAVYLQREAEKREAVDELEGRWTTQSRRDDPKWWAMKWLEEHARKTPAPQLAEGEWVCENCTFVNQPGTSICEICGKSRDVGASVLEGKDLRDNRGEGKRKSRRTKKRKSRRTKKRKSRRTKKRKSRRNKRGRK